MIRPVLIATAAATCLWAQSASRPGEARAMQAQRHAAQEHAALTYIRATNARQSPAVALKIARAIFRCAAQHRIDPLLLLAVVQQESAFNPRAVGTQGERGLMQLMPAAARAVGLPWTRAFNIHANICAGAAYLRALDAHDRDDMLRRYNGGESYPRAVLTHYHIITRRLKQ